MAVNFRSLPRLMCAATLLWPTAVLPLDVTKEELEPLCGKFGDLAYYAASKREAGADLEDVNAMMVQVLSDGADGKVNKSVAAKMFGALALGLQPESGSKKEVAQWVYRNCMTTDWLEED